MEILEYQIETLDKILNHLYNSNINEIKRHDLVAMNFIERDDILYSDAFFKEHEPSLSYYCAEARYPCKNAYRGIYFTLKNEGISFYKMGGFKAEYERQQKEKREKKEREDSAHRLAVEQIEQIRKSEIAAHSATFRSWVAIGVSIIAVIIQAVIILL